MNVTRIVVAGYVGDLARATSEALLKRGYEVSLLPYPRLPEGAGGEGSSRILCIPFAPSMSRRALARKEEDLARLRSVLEWALRSAVRRVVLPSHAIAYGASMKNPGLLEEGRPTLLPKTSADRRWLEAENMLFSYSQPPSNPPQFSAAAIRLCTVLHPEEGDFAAKMLAGKTAVPMAGYDPQLQFMSLEDAAEALACALVADATGIFNAAAEGTVPIKAAVKAAVPVRIPVNGVIQKPIRTMLWRAGWTQYPGEAADRIKYNWTVSSRRAQDELGFRAQMTSSQALKQYLAKLGKGRPKRVKDGYDEFGLDIEYMRRWAWWFEFLRKVYWRAEIEGMEHIPTAEPALLTANHRGFMPFDGVIHRSAILEAKKRHIRFLVIPSLFKFPFLSDFLIKQGGVVASQTNANKLFARGELVGIFPEGINGAFRMFKGAYKIGEMSRNAFARMAIENGVPLIPAATIGHVEIFPILARVNSSFVVRHTGWPFLPITPTFPLLPIPLPTKWHIRYLEPVPISGYAPSDATNPKVVNELAETVRDVMQRNIDEMLRRRKHIFFGNIFDHRKDASRRDSAGTG